MEFGDTLRRLREDAGMTQEDVVVGPQDEPVRILGVVVCWASCYASCISSCISRLQLDVLERLIR